ncbi:hypothetical protein L596_028773 [Steinernema carpocapsae]|uniref:Uncharacterized protein n=1 Tax=Steinernema carpocapsae TaxID=34508 RepID=A0A4U5M0D8_STECR|nr:hypothetical protein L596_028773 [Steinernema carpocapsae]
MFSIPESQCTTRYFHFAKNIMDYAERKGLRDAYSDPESRELYDWIRTFVLSAMLPEAVFMERLYPFLANNVPAGAVQAQSQSITEVAKYISPYWIPRRTLWEQYQNDGPRTTNHAEAWHNQSRILFTSQHPQLGLFPKKIKKEITAQAL